MNILQLLWILLWTGLSKLWISTDSPGNKQDSLLSVRSSSTPVGDTTDTMDKVNFTHSYKDIPFPSKTKYKKELIVKTENFLERVRWKLYWIRNPNNNAKKETWGFKTPFYPPQMNELKNF